MHAQGCLQLCPALMLEPPEASGAERVALQRHETSVHLACFGIRLVGISRRDAKDSKELEPGFD
jgi:hypothetical protein